MVSDAASEHRVLSRSLGWATPRKIMCSAAALGALFSCAQTPVVSEPSRLRPGLIETAPVERVTREIQDGIEAHIREQTRLGGGVFKLTDGDQTLDLKLVRVHTEYLANLGPDRHFACIDLATADGHVYDVDFFLKGQPGAMTVTETTIHKRNGQPRYVWEQLPDDTWVRVDAEDASPVLLGVIEDHDSFEFTYKATLPEIDGASQMWLPLATSDVYQDIEILSIDSPGTQNIIEDEVYGNRILHVVLGPGDSGREVVVRYQVERSEKAIYEDRNVDLDQHLAAERMVPATDEFMAIATSVCEGKDGDLVRARALYDHVIDHLRYAKYGTEYGQGDANFACDSARGNCTDYHSYFIALARSVNIPARFAIGASIPSARDRGGINGYHCWAEFYTDGRWWPVDISEADKCSKLSTYYFGHHPANRIELSRGRDLRVDPSPKSGPINFLAYPLLEVEGEIVKTKIDFSFRRHPDA